MEEIEVICLFQNAIVNGIKALLPCNIHITGINDFIKHQFYNTNDKENNKLGNLNNTNKGENDSHNNYNNTKNEKEDTDNNKNLHQKIWILSKLYPLILPL